MIHIIVDGPPVGKGRPRFFIRRQAGTDWRKIGTSTPKKTVNYEAILAAAGGEAMARRPPLEGPLSVRVTAFMPLAVSWSKKKTAAALEGIIRPGKPDADNLLKVLDALNGIVWRDDAQIAEARISKVYDVNPRLEVEISPLINGAA